MRRVHTVHYGLVGAVLLCMLAGCSFESEPKPTLTATVQPAPVGDGILRVGTVLPTTGPAAVTTAAQAAGVELAVREINEAGGVLGVHVEVLHRDSGEDGAAKVEAVVAEFAARGVDVVIGLSSSGLLQRMLPQVVAAGVAAITTPIEAVEPDEQFSARVRSMNPEVVDARFASEAYDATMVAALAAIIRDNDNGISVARALHDTSDGGVVCHSFGECLNVLTTEDDMNYNGVSGPFAIGEMDKAYFAAKT